MRTTQLTPEDLSILTVLAENKDSSKGDTNRLRSHLQGSYARQVAAALMGMGTGERGAKPSSDVGRAASALSKWAEGRAGKRDSARPTKTSGRHADESRKK